MTAYPPQPPSRKLTRSRTNKMLGGVCAGVANYLNMDVNLVRILTVVLSLFTGIPVVAYIVCLLVVPEEDAPPYVGPETVHVPESATRPAPQPSDPVWGPEGAPWDRGGAAAPGSGPQNAAGSAAGTEATPSPSPGPAPQAGAEPQSGAESQSGVEPRSGAEPAAGPADSTVPPESGIATESEPLGEDPATHPAPGQESSWESSPADPTDPSATTKD